MHMSKNPSTTVLIASTIVSREKKGAAGSDAQEAREKMWLTIDTFQNREK